MSWSKLREEFNVLNPAQLNQLLSNYHLDNGKERPADWAPSSNDQRLADDVGKIEPVTTELFLELHSNMKVELIPNSNFFISPVEASVSYCPDELEG